MDEWTWQLAANCRGYPSEMFFLDGLRGAILHLREAAARQVCETCPVRIVCLQHALDVPELYGIWGATSARERARLRNRGRAAMQSPVTV